MCDCVLPESGPWWPSQRTRVPVVPWWPQQGTWPQQATCPHIAASVGRPMAGRMCSIVGQCHSRPQVGAAAPSTLGTNDTSCLRALSRVGRTRVRKGSERRSVCGLRLQETVASPDWAGRGRSRSGPLAGRSHPVWAVGGGQWASSKQTLALCICCLQPAQAVGAGCKLLQTLCRRVLLF